MTSESTTNSTENKSTPADLATSLFPSSPKNGAVPGETLGESEDSVATVTSMAESDRDDDESEDDIPLAQRQFKSETLVREEVDAASANGVDKMDIDVKPKEKHVEAKKEPVKRAVKKPIVEESDSEDEPLAKKATKKKAVDDSDSEDDEPLTKKVKTDSRPQRKAIRKPIVDDSDESDKDEPLVKKLATKKSEEFVEDSESEDEPLVKKMAQKKKPAKKKAADSDSDASEASTPKRKAPAKKPAAKKKAAESDSEDEPLIQKVKPQKKAAAKKRAKEDSDSEDVPLAKVAASKKQKAESSGTAAKKEPKAKKEPDTEGTPKKSKKEQEDEEEEETYKWWLDQDRDDSIKWQTLEHSGVYFPPDYEPHGVKMNYDGKPVKLSPASEEVAGFFAALLGTQYVENPTFCKNFFNDFQEILDANDPGHPIKEFGKCDFRPMFEHFERVKEQKKAMTKEEKEVIKQEKKALEEKYGYAFIDGRREKVGNFRIEPPGLFRGRGDHPKTGTLKRRVLPEQVTINIGKEAKVPEPPAGHQWAAVVHDNTVSWLATWTENVNNNIKYVFFAAGSSLKGMSDFKKFEKARELKKHIDIIRRDYMEQLRDKVMAQRQMATALWLIDKLALRAGNEKGDDEADTVGCCSLRYEHVELDEEEADVPDPDHPGRTKAVVKKMVTFDFLGKDSIRYYNRVEVDPQVWKNLKLFRKEPKKEGDPLFDRLTTQMLNKHLNSLMPGLTAKVFRTYNASITFQNELKKTPGDANVAEKVLAYNRANRQVAILCNHQRTVSKAHGTQMEKISEKILMLKYELHEVKKEMLALEPSLKKKRPELLEPESDMDDETLERKAEEYKQQELEKLEKRYAKMCEKAEAEGKEKPEKPKLQKKEASSMDRLEKKFESLQQKIVQAKTMRVDKDENKTTALGTSKINYIDPRITSAWCNRFSVPIEKMFTKTLRDKFKWAMESEADWVF